MDSVKLFEKFNKYPGGSKIFTKLVCTKAPYFGSIKPQITHFEKGLCQAKMKKRRAITNHLGSVHAIAMCNIAELCGGLAVDGCMPKDLRWIPVEMCVQYKKKAMTDLECSAQIDPSSLVEGKNEVQVSVKDNHGEEVFTAQIKMYVSKKKK